MVNFHPLVIKELAIKYYNSSKKTTIKQTLTNYNISNGSLFRWIKLKKNNNLLENKQIYNKKTKITPVIKCYIRTYILRKLHFDYKLLLNLIKTKFKISISKSSLYNIISKLNLTRKKIKKETIVKNKIKHNRDIRNFKKSINGISLDKIISIDESHFDNEISSIYGWSLKGTEIRQKMHLKKKVRYTLICAVNNKKVVHSMIIKGSANAEIFKEFIKELDKKTDRNVYLLLDNARIHHSKIVKEFITTLNHTMLFNAPYCPCFNPIEKVFSKIKQLVRMNYNNTDPDKLKNNINKSLKKITTDNLQNYFRNSLEI